MHVVAAPEYRPRWWASCASDAPVRRTPGPGSVARPTSSPWATPSPPPPACRIRRRPRGCHKSTNNYPAILARPLHVSRFDDVTCSGATTEDVINRSQQTDDGLVARQSTRSARPTDLITITIGANDIGLAGDAKACQVESADPTPCTARFVVDNVDRLSRSIIAQLPVWSTLIDQVRAKAPRARIIMVGYGIFIRPGGCFPDQPILPRDADYLQSKVDELDDRQRQLATEKGIEYFDTRSIIAGP